MNKVPTALTLMMIIVLSLSYGLLLTIPAYQTLHLLNADHYHLQQRWQQSHQQFLHRQQLQQNLILDQQRYQTQLRALQHVATWPQLFNQITLLANAHNLQMTVLKPGASIANAGLVQQSFHLEVKGKEDRLISFLQLLCHQFWLTQLQQLQLVKAVSDGARLQLTLTIYYAIS